MRFIQRMGLSLAAAFLVLAGCGGGGGGGSTSAAPPPVQPPTGLTYSVNPATYTVGVAITPNSPSSSGGAVTSYSVSPSLPAGLALNSTTGVISGTPTAVTASSVFTVTATNTGGTTTATLTITVKDAAPN